MSEIERYKVSLKELYQKLIDEKLDLMQKITELKERIEELEVENIGYSNGCREQWKWLERALEATAEDETHYHRTEFHHELKKFLSGKYDDL